MQRRRLRRKESKEISREVFENSGVSVEGEMDELDFGEIKIILVDNEPLLLGYGGKHYLSVYGAIKLKPEKYKITVDSGALKFIMNGADIMKPGIVFVDSRVREGDFVYVTVEGKESAIAVGIALCDAEEMKGKGKAVKNLHYLRDKVWDYLISNKLIKG